MEKSDFITVIDKKELSPELCIIKEEYDKLYAEIGECRDKYNLDLEQKNSQLRELEKKFKGVEECFYHKFLGKYILITHKTIKSYISGGKITFVKSVGSDHDSCHIGGIIFYYNNGQDSFHEPYFSIRAYNEGNNMYPMPIDTSGEDTEFTILEEEDFFERVQDYMLQTFCEFKKVCKNTNVGVVNDKLVEEKK